MVIDPIISTAISFIVGGLCTAVVKLVQDIKRKDDAIEQAVKALIHDSFFRYCRYLLKEGHLTTETLENLEHLYISYKAMGLNGSGDKMMEECKKMPIK